MARRSRARKSTNRVVLPPDEELLPALLKGDDATFALVLDALTPSLLRLARVYVRSQALAEEVVQETWTAVLRGLPRFEGRSSLKTWIFTILANRARTRAVREARTLPMSALGGEGDDRGGVDPERLGSGGGWLQATPSANVDSPESLVLALESAALMERTLAGIPTMQRAVVILRDVEGVSSHDACNLLDISESNQRVLLHRGRLRLRTVLTRHLNGEREGSD